MSTRDKILELLESNKGRSLSGEEIAKMLSISRAAVWKAVKLLERDGYDIKAVPSRGYSLALGSDILSAQGIVPYLTDRSAADKILVYKSLESTNKTAKEMALDGCGHGTVVIADSQTAGKGRHGRSFYSPPGSGLYMSLVLRSGALELPDITMITPAAAVAVCKAVKTVAGVKPEIKWVNDVLLGGKKICGILTEAVTDFESRSIDWVVLGIGINISTIEFPDELNLSAASILPEGADGTIRNRLAAELINSLISSNAWMSGDEIYSEYKSRLTMLGKTVTVLDAEGAYDAVALDIDKSCRLIVRKADGTFSALSSGEVSVRASNAGHA